MRNIILLSAIILASLFSACHSDRLLLLPDGNYAVASSLAPEQRSRLEAAQDSLIHARAVKILRDRQFVIEADRIIPKSGRTINVNSMTNFLMVEGDNATVQVASTSTVNPGPNGLGGITLTGRISDLRFKEDNNGGVTMSFNVTGNALAASVTITLQGSGNIASATIRSTFQSYRAEMRGRVVPLSESGTYKGSAI